MSLTGAERNAKGRFLLKKENIGKNTFLITGDEVSHALRSLRVKEGERICATDGKGSEFLGEVKEIRKGGILCQTVERKASQRENTISIWLAQPVIKPGRMETVIEKCTELGVTGFLPFLSANSSRGSEGRPGKERLARWKRVAESALKQSLGCVLPEISEVKQLRDVLESIERFEKTFFADERCEMPFESCIKDISQPLTNALLIIGPEGGFSESERESLLDRKAVPFSLGKRRLRAETAAILSVGLFLCSLEWCGKMAQLE